MTLAASGTLSLSDIRTEFGGGSGAISMSNLYRGGTRVRAKAANNTSTNLAASVPTSGAVAFANFHGQAKGFRKTYTATATNQNASTVFGDDYGVDYPKEIVINSGVELGATGTGEEALQVNSGLSGTMTITNNGILSGAGGSANGGAGGDAFEANATCTLINNGTIRAGGGGGGRGGNGGSGGNGGQGRTTSTSYSGWASHTMGSGYGTATLNPPGNGNQQFRNCYINAGSNVQLHIREGGTTRHSAYGSGGNASYGGPTPTYSNMTMQVFATNSDGDYRGISNAGLQYRNVTTSTNYHSGGSGGGGGAGGAGGRGQGYNHAKANGSGGSGGSGGSSGGTNAGNGGSGGSGGTGGNGGTYGNGGGNGASGATGNSGGNGNHTNGSSGSGGAGGSSGGAAGKYIRGLSNVTFTNNGTVQGGTA